MAAGTAQDVGEERTLPPPSLPFDGFIELLEVMAEGGLPRQIDEGLFGEEPSLVGREFLDALRFFGLIDRRGQPMTRLMLLVDPASRPAALEQLLTTYYLRPMGLGTESTTDDVTNWFAGQGVVVPEHLRMAMAFLIDAADQAGVQLPEVIANQAEVELDAAPDASGEAAVMVPKKAARRPAAPRPKPKPKPKAKPTAKAKAKTKPRAKAAGPVRAPTARRRATAPKDPEQILEDKKNAYIDYLMELVKSSGDHPDEKLLDRIERLLGLSSGEPYDNGPPGATDETGAPERTRRTRKSASSVTTVGQGPEGPEASRPRRTRSTSRVRGRETGL